MNFLEILELLIGSASLKRKFTEKLFFDIPSNVSSFQEKCFVTMCKAPRNSDHLTFQKRLGTSDSMTDGSSKQYSP